MLLFTASLSRVMSLLTHLMATSLLCKVEGVDATILGVSHHYVSSPLLCQMLYVCSHAVIQLYFVLVCRQSLRLTGVNLSCTIESKDDLDFHFLSPDRLSALCHAREFIIIFFPTPMSILLCLHGRFLFIPLWLSAFFVLSVCSFLCLCLYLFCLSVHFSAYVCTCSVCLFISLLMSVLVLSVCSFLCLCLYLFCLSVLCSAYVCVSVLVLSDPGPLILQRIKAIVGDPCLDDKATTECLRALREEWMRLVVGR